MYFYANKIYICAYIHVYIETETQRGEKTTKYVKKNIYDSPLPQLIYRV